jgi:thioredoxin 1
MSKILQRLFGKANEPEPQTGEGTSPIHVTDIDFQSQILDSDLPVVVDFWAPWCMPCRMVAPILDRLAKDYDGQIKVAKVNTDENQEWAIQFGVQGIPTLLFVKDSKVVDRIVGVVSAGQIKRRLEAML